MPSFGLTDNDSGPGYLLASAGQAVREDCPPDGCCDGGDTGCQLWRRIRDCSNLFRFRWVCDTATCIDGSPLEVGMVVAYGGDCWIVNSITNPDPPENLRIEDDAFPCFVSCTACSEPTTQCCDVNPVCGVGSFPIVVDHAVSITTLEYLASCGSSCSTFPVREYVQPGLPGSAEVRFGQLCASDSGNLINTVTERVDNPCGPGQTDRVSRLTANYAYSLIDGAGFEASEAVGFNDGRTAVIGTDAAPPVPNLLVKISAGLHVTNTNGLDGATVVAVVSTRDPSRWFMEVTGATSTDEITASGSVTASAGCGGAMGVSFDLVLRNLVSLGGCDRQDEVKMAGSVSATFSGFVGCGSGRPGDRTMREGTVQSSPVDPRVAAYMAQDPLAGCQGCGG